MLGVPLWLNIPLCLLALTAGGWMGVRAHRREPIHDGSKMLQHSPHLVFVVSLPLVLLIFHVVWDFFPQMEWRLPYEVQFYYGVFAWALLIGCFTYFAGFGAAVFLLSRHPKRGTLGFVLVLLLFSVQQFHWRATAFTAPDLRPPRVTRQGYVYQSSDATCVPAAAATLLNRLGDPHSEAELAARMKTEVDGTTPSQLVMTMRDLGYSERTVPLDHDGLEAVHPPAVLFILNNSHAITVLDYNDDVVEFWDPNNGLKYFSRRKFDRLTRGAHAIEFHPTVPASAPSRETGPAT